ncbi:Serine protease, subtilisin family [Blastococcus aurantiacus]|uniref:Serine protease, subtilisin family n=1 Tax=Blastococcus aurantiacus TaxID=1550231 RepID=A0A1G7LHU8_9ACTN|nr:S8 family serine peptidase [Blastococcus aurantiacus]SDF49048.1 Serine protease, subtilisin family [Blastococcus aurantiacus]
MSDEVTDLPAVLVDELAPAEQQTLTDLTEGEGVQLEAFVATPDGPEIVTLEAGGRSDATAAVQLLERQASVEAADLSVVARATAGEFEQWGNVAIRSDAARAEVPRGALADVVVAVLDTGVAPHEELAGSLLPGKNFTDSPGGATDDRHGHGTHVAGTVAADAGSKVEGVAVGAKVLPVKVLADGGSGSSAWISGGIIWAADQGADVINMSLGGQHSSTVYNQAISYARSKGATVVAAAGNDNTSATFMPAAAPGVIGVAATDEFAEKAWFSNYGSYVDVSAPGEFILSTSPEYGYVYMSGTSMAAPHVAGVVALMEAAAPAITPDQVEQALTASATDLGAAGRDDVFGHGQVDAVRAVRGAKALAGPANRAPVAGADSFSLPADPGTRTLAVTANDTDADGDPLRIVSATQGAKGQVGTTATSLTYTPTRSGPFVDTVTYTVSDGRGGTAVGSVTVSVAGPVVRKPSAPRVGTPTALAAGVRLSWSAPADNGGAAIASYRVTAYRGTVPVKSVVVSGRTTTATVTGLTNGTAYRFAVTAANSAGTGPSSAQVSATPRTTPGAPRITSVAAQVKAVAVRWAKPASTGGAPVTGYLVRAYSGGKLVRTVNASATATSVSVSGLASGRSYTFRVLAKNAAGTGGTSAASAVVRAR